MSPASDAQRALVIAEARSWLRTPYHPMARGKGLGADCATLPAEVYAACGLIPPQDIGPYPPDWHLHHSEDRYLAQVLAVAQPTEQPQPGDFALWRVGRCWAHGAILITPHRVVHAVQGQGVVEADLDNFSLSHSGGVPRPRRFFTLWPEA